jgi:hypothetical protein
MSAITFVVAVVTASALLTVAACISRAFQDRLGFGNQLLRWSWWRRRHQHHAQQAHYQQQSNQEP